MEKVLLNDFKKQWAEIGTTVVQAVEQVGASGWYILGNNVSNFEVELSKSWGLEHAIGCANGLDAIEIALRCLDIKPGDKVLTTPMSAFATTLAIIRAGGVPVFVDTDKLGLIDLDLVEKTLSQRSDIEFLLPVHLYGHCLNLDRLKEIKEKYKLKLVEDCAQSIFAKWNDTPCGSVGQYAATSFYPTKNLGCIGDGGAILCSDMELGTKAKKFRDYGQSSKYNHQYLGLNSRLDELQAAILLEANLPNMKRWTSRRKEIAIIYLNSIKNPHLTIHRNDLNSDSVWHLFPIFCENRDKFQTYLRDNLIESGIHYPDVIYNQRALENTEFEVIGTKCSNAERVSKTELSIPIHPYLTEQEVNKIVEVCNNWQG